MTCPCGSGAAYADCCEPRHDGSVPAPTAEALMRSRYSAFAVGDEGYLLRSWHPRTRPDRAGVDPAITWTGLELVATQGGGPDDDTGVVEFRAHHRSPAGAGTLHERSSFARRGGRWVYVDGVDPDAGPGRG